MTESALSSFFHTVQGEQEFNGELDSEPVVLPVSDEPLYMSDKRWVPAIYVHARHGADQAFIDQILEEYTKKYFYSETKPKYHVLNEYEEYISSNDKDNNLVNIKTRRNFYVRIVDEDTIRYGRIFSYPAAERILLTRGYIAAFEMRVASKGNQTETAYLAEQMRAIDCAVAMMEQMLITAGPGFFGWRSCDRKQSTMECLGVLTGAEGFAVTARIPKIQRMFDKYDDEDSRTDPIPEKLRSRLEQIREVAFDSGCCIPIVRYKGLLLGAHQVKPYDDVYAARRRKPSSCIKRFRQLKLAGSFFGRNADCVKEQICFELSEQAAASFYSHAAENGITVTPGIIMVWFSQVLMTLQTCAWRVEIEELPSVVHDELIREADTLPKRRSGRGRPIGVEKSVRGEAEANLRDRIQKIAVGMLDKADVGNRIQASQICYGADREDLRLARAHGATIDLFDYNNDLGPPDRGEKMAYWIGQMKRLGHASLTIKIADDLLRYADEVDRFGDALPYTLLGGEIWNALLDAASDVCEFKQSVEIEYHWARDLRNPRSAERLPDGGLILTGPLLSFPAASAATWKRHADCVAGNKGFFAPDHRNHEDCSELQTFGIHRLC